VHTSLTPILITLSSKSDRGTFDLFRNDTVEMDDIGLTNKSSVTMYMDGPFANDDFAVDDLGSTNLNGTNLSSEILLLREYNFSFVRSVAHLLLVQS
jgi:hypothetical protein